MNERVPSDVIKKCFKRNKIGLRIVTCGLKAGIMEPGGRAVEW
jgi:hypothetical protein